ncbi:type IV toxin-antitoxin system AbiEi family antitoxin [uncultured Kiloniella sp.]|uniref:type IV toxin-antitoxin system AbiEi family antitoxin n=1 Tax=uncultured Kiloniella sp. TaxID=1133091 RepID=UPI002611765D|nr:type IV toxin-antitoxin system AbiEi family antitoxin [uncultured Kiloniella sp.]
MSTDRTTKINKLLMSTPSGVVMLSSWLVQQGYSLDLQKRYKKSQWLKSIGTGAVIRYGDDVDYHGGIYALQKQALLSVHVGGRTALSLLGKSHYLEMSAARAILFGGEKERLPVWFKNHDWNIKVEYFATSFLPKNIGLLDFEMNNYSLKVSSPARAILECLYLIPKHQELFECYELMEGLNNLRPKSVQNLLENCSSVKVKRMFLYLAEKCNHGWVEYLDLSKVDLGTGKRSFVKNGTYVNKYKITVPKEFEKNEKSKL